MARGESRPKPWGLEVLAIAPQRRGRALWIDEAGEGVADAQPRREVGSVRAGPQQPGLRHLGHGGHQWVPGERVVLGEGLVQPGQRLQDLLLVIGLRGVLAVLLQRQVEHRAGGRPPHAQVDPPGRHRLQLLEQLGDLEGAVVVHQDRPRPQPDPGRGGCRGGDQQLGVVGRPRAAQVVLGEPDPVVAQALGVPDVLQRVGQGVLLGGTGATVPRSTMDSLMTSGSSTSMVRNSRCDEGNGPGQGRLGERRARLHEQPGPSQHRGGGGGSRTRVLERRTRSSPGAADGVVLLGPRARHRHVTDRPSPG